MVDNLTKNELDQLDDWFKGATAIGTFVMVLMIIVLVGIVSLAVYWRI